MSSTNSRKVKNLSFVERFSEACNSSKPADVARLLNISYQAAKNYLEGRLPDSSVLLSIAEQTNYSIHWILTGQGDKFVGDSLRENTPLLSGKLREFVRRECRELINEALSNEAAQPKSVVLTSEKIKAEKVINEVNTFSGKRQ